MKNISNYFSQIIKPKYLTMKKTIKVAIANTQREPCALTFDRALNKLHGAASSLITQ